MIDKVVYLQQSNEAKDHAAGTIHQTFINFAQKLDNVSICFKLFAFQCLDLRQIGLQLHKYEIGFVYVFVT